MLFVFFQSIDEKINRAIVHQSVSLKSAVKHHVHYVKNLYSAHRRPALTHTIAKDENSHSEYLNPAYI